MISELLPHAEPMVLIDSVSTWDAQRIVCHANSHTQTNNPLRINGHLSVYGGIEYAAQAMAAHGRLTAQQAEAPRQGFVATASKIMAHAATLDTIQASLEIQAIRLAASGDSSLYQFTITADGQLLLEGQLMVVTEEPAGL